MTNLETPKQSTENQSLQPKQLSQCWARWALLAFGWLNVGLGIVGIIVPGLPTTVFLLIALWAFSKSSERFQTWLWTHPKFGPSLRAWHVHRVIPTRAKISAVVVMSLSLTIVSVYVAESWLLPVTLGMVMAAVAAYLFSHRGSIPEDATVVANPPA